MELVIKDELKNVAVQRAIKRNTHTFLSFNDDQMTAIEEFKDNFYLEIGVYVSRFDKKYEEIEF